MTIDCAKYGEALKNPVLEYISTQDVEQFIVIYDQISCNKLVDDGIAN